MKNSYEREKTKTEGNQPPKSDVETATPKMSDFREKRNGEQHKLTEKTLASLDTEKKGMPLNWDETETKVSEVTTNDSDIVSSKARTVSSTAYCERNDAFAKLEQLLRRTATKNTSPNPVGRRTRKKNAGLNSSCVGSPAVKLERSESERSSRSSVFESTESSHHYITSDSMTSSPKPAAKSKRKLLSPTVLEVASEDEHPATSEMNVATLASIQKKRRKLKASSEALKKKKKTKV